MDRRNIDSRTRTPGTASADEVARQLPYLRRYARALTGGVGPGDSLVAAVLEALLESPRREAMCSRVGLFRLLSTRFNDPAASDNGPAPASGSPATSLAIQACLLQELEGFSSEDAAKILDVTLKELHALMQDGAHAIYAHGGAKVLILDTETLVTLEISSALEELGYRIAGTPRTCADATALARSTQPDVIILASAIRFDTSLEPLAFGERLQQMCGASLVLMTGYPERFLQGDRDERAFVMAKPFRYPALAAMVSQSLRFRRVISS
jgi:hypothetical protein